jgi:hypothetical protein
VFQSQGGAIELVRKPARTISDSYRNASFFISLGSHVEGEDPARGLLHPQVLKTDLRAGHGYHGGQAAVLVFDWSQRTSG